MRTKVVGTGVRRAGVAVIALTCAGTATRDGRMRACAAGTGVRRAGVAVIALTCGGAAIRGRRVDALSRAGTSILQR